MIADADPRTGAQRAPEQVDPGQLEAPYLDAFEAGGSDPGPAVLERATALAAQAHGARRTWFLAGGALDGAQAACLAVARLGRSAVVGPEVHPSTVSGFVVSGLRPHLVGPTYDAELDLSHGVSAEALEDALELEPDVAAAFVVSPTFSGVLADVAAMAEVAHRRGVALVVDERWGAHLAFHSSLPQDALSAGADLVISGTNETLGSLAPTAMLHLGASPSIDQRDVSRALAIVQSADPVPALLASLDAARRSAATEGAARLGRALDTADAIRDALERVPGVALRDEPRSDRSAPAAVDSLCLAIDLRASGVSALDAARVLAREPGLRVELGAEHVLVARLGIPDPTDAAEPAAHGLIAALERAVAEAPASLRRRRRFARGRAPGPPTMTPREAYLSSQETVALSDAAGRLAAEVLCVHPPGTVAVLPGERIPASAVAEIERALGWGAQTVGLTDPSAATVLVVARDDDPEESAAAPADEPEAAPAASAASAIAAAPAAESPSVFEAFPARAYLEKYYSGVGPENAALLGTMIDYLAGSDAAHRPGDRGRRRPVALLHARAGRGAPPVRSSTSCSPTSGARTWPRSGAGWPSTRRASTTRTCSSGSRPDRSARHGGRRCPARLRLGPASFDWRRTRRPSGAGPSTSSPRTSSPSRPPRTRRSSWP